MVHLANYTEPAPWLTIGQVFDPDASSVKSQASGRLALTPSGKRLPLEDEGSQAQVLELTEQGFYEIRGQKANSDVTVIASNVDPAESDLTSLDPAEIVAAATGGAVSNAQGTASDVPLTPQAQERSQRLWWYLLCAGIVLLGADTAVLELALKNLIARALLVVFWSNHAGISATRVHASVGPDRHHPLRARAVARQAGGERRGAPHRGQRGDLLRARVRDAVGALQPRVDPRVAHPPGRRAVQRRSISSS